MTRIPAPNEAVERPGLEKLATGMEGFDTVSWGGLPRNRTTLVTGTAGSGKTLFATQFLVGGIEAGHGGVFVTFEDHPEDIRENMRGFGWDIPGLEEQGSWAFVDAAPDPQEETTVVGAFDLEALLARIRMAVERTGAERISIDSLDALFAQLSNHELLRQELFRMADALKKMGVTAVLTAERPHDEGEITRYGLQEFVADNVVILRHALMDERRRRTVEILKFRGAPHQNGQFPFTISPHGGMIVIPLSAIELTQSSSTVRIGSGIDELDAMCDGGFFRDSVILVSGATGTGKTLTVTHFLSGGFQAEERCLLFAFEESREQLVRNAGAWGMDFARMEEEGSLRIVNFYPHAHSLEDHLVLIKDSIDEFQPNRVAVDSLSALERVGSVRSYREFVINLTATIKAREIAGLFTATATSLSGGDSITEKHISTLTDSIILLRYVEEFGVLRRGLAVLKMRGSHHDRRVREYTIDQDGMHIGRSFRNVTGILWGSQTVFQDGDGGDDEPDDDET